MEDAEELRKKRPRDEVKVPLPLPEKTLEASMKKVRISHQVPGQLRLAQDLNEYALQAREKGLIMKVDPKSPLTMTVQFSTHQAYCVVVDKHYPHKPPVVRSFHDGSIIYLPILQNWLPVHTIGDVLIQLEIRQNFNAAISSQNNI